MIFQKHSECQEGRYQFTINKAVIPHSMSCTYCRNNANSLRDFSMAMRALKEKAQRALQWMQ